MAARKSAIRPSKASDSAASGPAAAGGAAAPATTARSIADWERVEAQFRAGSMSLREIAAEHSITEGAIRKRAKRDGWERDLSQKVKVRADTLVRKEQVRSEVRADQTITETLAVEVSAQVEARVRLAHRADIGRSRELVRKLLDELETQTDNLPTFAALLETLAEAGADGPTIRDVMGHSSLTVTSRYLQSATESARRAVDRLPRLGSARGQKSGGSTPAKRARRA